MSKEATQHICERCHHSTAARVGLLAAILLTIVRLHDAAAQERPSGTTDAELVRSLKGFHSGDGEVNGIHLHYVAGGTGTPLILLPGWPETWWQYHKIMPLLARHFHVVSVDIRGMGLSSKPVDGYDKKTMAKDIHELVRHLGYDKVDIAGHDIGSMVAFAYAAQFPQATLKLAMMDVPHPDDGWMKIPLLPQVGRFGAKIDDLHPAYPCFFAFQQVKGLPERLLEGRTDIYLNFCVDYLTKDSASIDAFDRKVYTTHYSVRAGDSWFQAFPQDVLDAKQYPKLEMPVLGLASINYEGLKASLEPKASDVRMVKVDNSGHFFPEEQPEATAKALTDFFKGS
jgi:pimeloyl-ACP methyl ester carboxylesterase